MAGLAWSEKTVMRMGGRGARARRIARSTWNAKAAMRVGGVSVCSAHRQFHVEREGP